MLLAGLPLASGCSAQSAPTPDTQAAPQITTPADTRPITNLAQLSRARTAAALLPPNGLEPAAKPPPTRDLNATVQENLDRFFISNAERTRYSDSSDPPPGKSKLANAKAEQYSEFSYALLRQTLEAARAVEPDVLKRRKVRTDLAPVVLTALMNRKGVLTEIAIDQHSGDRAVDRAIIDACKRGLWSRNPPLGARTGDGTYRLRIEGLIINYSIDRNGRYSYDTHLALSIL